MHPREQVAAGRDEPVDLAAVTRRAARGPVAASLSPVRVRGDEALLERLVGNLAENAIRHNVPGGRALLTVGSDAGGGAVVRVENDGPVIPADAVDRLTQPFERLERSRARRGAGLGLSIVHAVAEAHGGALRLAPRPAGGLSAEVRLPARPPAVTAT